MAGWLEPLDGSNGMRMRTLLVLAGVTATAASLYLLVIGLGLLAFRPLGTPVSVLGFLGVCLGLALFAQGVMPWDTKPRTQRA